MYFPPPHLDSVADGTVVCVGLAACADDETGIRRRARRRRHGGTGNNGERVGLRSAGWDTGAGGTLGLWIEFESLQRALCMYVRALLTLRSRKSPFLLQ